MTTRQITMSLDGLRTNIMCSYARLKEQIEENTLEQYLSEDGDVFINHDDMERIYQLINELRENIGVLNCCSCKDIGMSDLSYINQQRGMGYIQREKEEDDE